MKNNISVILSNGIHRFHLSAAAAELSKNGVLATYLTAGYPGKLSKATAKFKPFSASRAWLRLLDREETEISHDKIRSYWSVEWMMILCVLIGKLFRSSSITSWLESFVFQWYGFLAAVSLIDKTADIYHYRAGFGGLSVKIARKRGMLCLCDHSAVHPALFDFMINNSGQFPAQYDFNVSRFWRVVLNDILRADKVVVNSEFVKKTMLFSGWRDKDISVVYLGIDEKFANGHENEKLRASSDSSVVRLAFAGRISRSKGFDVLANALSSFDGSWELYVAGGIDVDIRHEFRCFFEDKRVKTLGFVSRSELSTLLSSVDVFAFPSLAEGSARVVFEAMACGCYVITTPNAGSIVEDGTHGRIVPPGDVEALSGALHEAMGDIQRCRDIGSKNKRLIKNSYLQSAYGDGLISVYRHLLEGVSRVG